MISNTLNKNKPKDELTKNANTALTYATFLGDKDTVDSLIKSGFDVNLSDKNGNTPLMIAVIKGNKDIVDFLIKSGADVNISNNDRITPLFSAATSKRDKDIVDNLIKAGADVNLVDRAGFTALKLAEFNGDLGIVDSLLKAEALSTLVNSKNEKKSISSRITGIRESTFSVHSNDLLSMN